ncbi:hypothetical protein QCA50_016944 [Cerrena zonata]|uniref:Uncharacterized protein n=1 Tax=Cerrena zonata TaxID=2478898 RepID=A0AAW0FR66_9APHY
MSHMYHSWALPRAVYEQIPEYSARNYAVHSKRGDELAKCKTTHLKPYKCTKGSLLIFILAHIIHYFYHPLYDHLGIQRCVVRVERAREPSGSNNDTIPSAKDTITMYESSEKVFKVNDSKAKCCYVVRFNHTLHQIAPNDIPFKYMDYWFANNFYRLLYTSAITFYHNSYTVVQKYSRRNFRAGYFKDVPVIDGDSRVVIQDDLHVSVSHSRQLIGQKPDIFFQGPLSSEQSAPNPNPYDPKRKRQFAESDILAKYYETRRKKAQSDLSFKIHMRE